MILLSGGTLDLNKWRMAETAQELQDKKQTFLSCPLPSHFLDSATLDCTSLVLFVQLSNLRPWGPSLPGPPQPRLNHSKEARLPEGFSLC